MIKTKKQLFIIIVAIALVSILGTVTYAFFNYTRTGEVNVLRTGKISFVSTESGSFTLTNVVPIKRNQAANDNVNSSEVVITITGETDYNRGLEYLVTVEDFHAETDTLKKIPVGIIVTPEKDNTELGTASDNYFNNNVRGGNNSYYKVLSNSILKDGDYILVGFIKPGISDVNGKIGIRAFIDYDSIAVSDTYDGIESTSNMTTSEWVNGRTLLTTDEWNSLQGNNSIRFKVKVEANEGIWVEEPTTHNDLANFNAINALSSIKSTITEVEFVRMSEEIINTHQNLIDLEEQGGEGIVKGWLEGTKLYVASPGTTYFPENSSAMFLNWSSLEKVTFKNINTSEATNMAAMFNMCSSLEKLDLTSFDTSNVTSTNAMFYGCTNLDTLNLSSFNTSNVTNMSGMFANSGSLTTLDLSNFDTSNVTNMSGMFSNSSGLTTIDLSYFDTSNVTTMLGMFSGCTELQSVNLSGLDTSNVTNMSEMFKNCNKLETLDLSSFTTTNVTNTSSMFYLGVNNALQTIIVSNSWGISSATSTSSMFYNCTHLVGGAGTTYDSSKIDKTYAVTDAGPNSKGYLTYKYDTGDYSINAMGTLPTAINNEKLNIKEVYFSRMSQSEMQSRYTNATIKADLTYNNEGTVLGWLEANPSDNTKYNLYIVSTGDTYLTNGSEMFNGFSNLTKIEFNNVNMARVSTMYHMFYNCTSLVEIDMSHIDMRNVTDMSSLFRGDTSLKKVNLSYTGSNLLTNNGDMFYGCTNLEEINMAHFNFGHAMPRNNSGFRNLSNLKTINLSYANLSYGGMLYETFYNCTSLENINLTGVNTSKVNNMGYMFSNCTSLTSLDLSSFDTRSVTNTNYMFYESSNLETIYVSKNWNISSLGNGYTQQMFNGCSSIVGGNNTHYDSSRTNGTMAIVDGTNNQDGYLTLKTN